MEKSIVLGSVYVLGSFLLFSHIILFEQLFEGGALVTNSVLRESWTCISQTVVESWKEVAHLAVGLLVQCYLHAFHVLFDSAGAKIAGWLLLIIGIVLLTGKALVPFLVEHFQNMKVKFKNRQKQKKPIVTERKARRARKELPKEEVVTSHDDVDVQCNNAKR